MKGPGEKRMWSRSIAVIGAFPNADVLNVSNKLDWCYLKLNDMKTELKMNVDNNQRTGTSQ